MQASVENKSKFKYIYKNGILAVIFLIFLIISIVFHRRIFLFSSIITKIQVLLPIIYYLTLSVSLLICTALPIYYIVLKVKGIAWIDKAEALQKKLDIPNFICRTFVFLLFILTYLFTPCTVTGDSMKNTYQNKDRLICTNLFYTPKKGDVVVFDAMNYSKNITTEGTLYIKRILAVEGDLIEYDEKTNELLINHEVACQRFSYHMLKVITEEDEPESTFVIPKGKILVFGDNRIVSYDSRYFGLVDKSDVYGKVLFRVYPFKKTNVDIIE